MLNLDRVTQPTALSSHVAAHSAVLFTLLAVPLSLLAQGTVWHQKVWQTSKPFFHGADNLLWVMLSIRVPSMYWKPGPREGGRNSSCHLCLRRGSKMWWNCFFFVREERLCCDLLKGGRPKWLSEQLYAGLDFSTGTRYMLMTNLLITLGS